PIQSACAWCDVAAPRIWLFVRRGGDEGVARGEPVSRRSRSSGRTQSLHGSRQNGAVTPRSSGVCLRGNVAELARAQDDARVRSVVEPAVVRVLRWSWFVRWSFK